MAQGQIAQLDVILFHFLHAVLRAGNGSQPAIWTMCAVLEVLWLCSLVMASMIGAGAIA